MFNVTIDHGLRFLMALYDEKGSMTSRQLSEALDIPLPTTRKIMGVLVRAGLVTAVEGTKGGYTNVGNPTAFDAVSAFGTIKLYTPTHDKDLSVMYSTVHDRAVRYLKSIKISRLCRGLR